MSFPVKTTKSNLKKRHICKGYSTVISDFNVLLNILKFISISTTGLLRGNYFKMSKFSIHFKKHLLCQSYSYTTAFILSAVVFYRMNGASESKMETESMYTVYYRSYDWHNKPYNDYIVTTHLTPHPRTTHTTSAGPILGSGKASWVSCCPCILQ